MVNCVGRESFNFSLCNCPLRLGFFGGGEGAGNREQKTAEHRLEAVFKCSSEYAVSHVLQAEQNDEIFRLASR